MLWLTGSPTYSITLYIVDLYFYSNVDDVDDDYLHYTAFSFRIDYIIREGAKKKFEPATRKVNITGARFDEVAACYTNTTFVTYIIWLELTNLAGQEERGKSFKSISYFLN